MQNNILYKRPLHNRWTDFILISIEWTPNRRNHETEIRTAELECIVTIGPKVNRNVDFRRIITASIPPAPIDLTAKEIWKRNSIKLISDSA